MDANNVPMQKRIIELKGYSFHIPSYQRGYRWTKKDVEALLNDIYEFNAGTEDAPKIYCLQPLIVKMREDGSYEVVDGQQRLTTVFIFLKLVQNLTGFEPYQISFETREQSRTFLNSLSVYSGGIRFDNIDYFHITSAYMAMDEWLNKKAQKSTRFEVLSSMFKKITNHVIFIWHEIPADSKPVDIFTKVNMGKIRLSNAELIKALLFNKDNFKNEQIAEKEQQELALSWNRVERGLQDESLWLFLNEKTEYETRIDLIFSLLSKKYNDMLPLDRKLDTEEKSTERYQTFLIFYEVYRTYKEMKNEAEFVRTIWRDVETVYERFQEWYADLNKYHIIGYLITSGMKLSTIFELTEGKRKSETIKALVQKTIIKTLPDFDALKAVAYSEKASKLRNIFLLFNIATLVCKNEKHYRFPFDIYKKEKWDIEHIHATADDTEEADDNIGNLTLLLAKINRSYQDDVFAEKRKEIIQRDAKGWFIPLCTKNVFLKQYSENPCQMEKWDKVDKDAYIRNMWETLDMFWKGEFLQ